MTQRPNLSHAYAFWFYALTSCLALAALGWSAIDAFSLTMERNHAIVAAIAFEVAAMTEAVALSRARKLSEFAVPLLFTVASVAGSAVYNYAQVRNHAAANGLDDPAFLSVFAIGPLFAMIGLSMNAGREWRALELAQTAWDAAQQHAAQSAQAAEQRARENAAYDERKAQERESQRRHELAMAQFTAGVANATESQQPQPEAQHAPQRLRGAQLRAALAEWRNANPSATKADAARHFGVDPATITRNWQ